jgi:hypothetical protein
MYPLNFFNISKRSIWKERLSDHQPVIEQETISWNIMMQCKCRNNRYNNAFGLEESGEQYHERLKKVVFLLAQLCHSNPDIQSICLQEAPIAANDIDVFIDYAKKFQSLHKFIKSFENSGNFNAWGLVFLYNADEIHAQEKPLVFNKSLPIDADLLKDRIQCYMLTYENGNRQCMVNLHFPYELGKKFPGKLARVIQQIAMQPQQEKLEHLTIVGDFNFLITQFPAVQELGHIWIPDNNSTELSTENGGQNHLETVDAIIHVQKNCGQTRGYRN